MRKNLLTIFVFFLVPLILTGCVKKQNLPSGNKEEEPRGQKEESFTGKIKDAILKGVSLKCNWSKDDFSSIGYIKNKKYYGETVIKGIKSYVIMADNCLWSWQENKNEGLKICFEKSKSEDLWNSENAPQDDFHCTPAVVSDSLFNPPAKVNFVDMDEIMRKAGVTIPEQKD